MLFILNKSHEVVGSLNSNGDLSRITSYFDDSYVQDLATGAETFQFSTLADNKESQHLVVGNFIAFREQGEFKLFNIIQIEETHEDTFIKNVYCEMASVELINEIIRPMKVLNSSLLKFLNTILGQTEWQLGKMDAGFTQVYDFEITDYKSVYELIQEYAIGTYGAEISYRVEIEHGKIIGKYIDCYSKRGNENGFRFAYGSNLTSVIRTVDTSNLATALIPVGNGGITIRDLDLADKPLGQDFITNETAYKQWNINGSHIFGVHREDTDSPQELIRLARLALEERANPKIKYEMKVEILDRNVNIGDTVNVVDHEFNPPLYLSARVNQITKSRTNPFNDEVVLANFKELDSNITSDMRALASQLEGYIDSQFPIGGDKIQSDSLTGDHLQSNTVTGTHIIANAITADKIDADQITGNHIQANTISGNHLQANIITGGHIQAETITGTNIKGDTITGNHLQGNTITGNHIQAGSITAGSGIIADGAIGNAHISDLTADKVTGGTIETSKVDIAGANSNLLIRGNRLQVFEGQGNDRKERVSLGDVNNDGSVYGLRVRGADGKTVLMDENGVTSEGITDGSITNEHISDDTKIEGYKLNINSVVREINGATETINGTKIDIEGTNLGVQLSEIVKTQTEQEESISNNTAKIQANQNAIKLKVDEQKYTEGMENINSILEKQSAQIEINKNDITSKVSQSWVQEQGYQTSSEVQQTVDALQIKFQESGGYNLLYNGDFKRKLESWTQDVPNSFGWSDGLSCKNGRGVYSRGALQTTKALRQQNIPLDVNEDTYTLSYWQYTTQDGTDGTTNPFRNIEVAIGYTDGTWSYHSTGQSNFDVWERKVIRIKKPSDKHFLKANVGLWCRDTTKMVYFSQIVFEEGEIAHQWSPNPNEVHDGITTIDKDGIKVTSSNSNTHTVMDSSSFRVENNQGGTVAEFSNNSTIPNLTAGIITSNEVHAGNVCSKSPKSTDIKFIYVNGSTGNDNNNGSQTSPYKTVQRAIDDINDKQDQSVTIYVYNSVQGFELKGVSGTGIITFSLQDSAVINGYVILGGVTNAIKITNETGSLKATLKNGIGIYRCTNVDIYGVTFRGVNGSGNNILVQDTSYCAVNSCDLGGLSTRLDCAIAVKASLLWLHGCRGSNILDVVGQYAFSHVMMARGGTSNVPDYSSGLLVNYDGSGRIQNWTGGTFTKTPSSGWNPSYTPTQKTSTWSFNKIWSDETKNGWSDRQELIQGYSSSYDTGRWTGYLQMTDGMASIKSTISGSTNLSGRVYVQRKTSSGASTGTCCMYASDGTHIGNISMARGAGAWFTLSSAIVTKIMNGAITYFYLKNDSDNINTYMKMETLGKIEITYTK